MEKIKKVVSLLLIAIIFLSLSSCNPFSDNLMEKAKVSQNVAVVAGELEEKIENTKKIEIIPNYSLQSAFQDFLKYLGWKDTEILNAANEILEYFVPEAEEINFNISISTLPNLEQTLQYNLLSFNSPQDIKAMEEVLSLKLDGVAKETINTLLGAIAKITSTSQGKEIFNLKDFIVIPSDAHDFTNADLVTLQMVLDFLFKVLPKAVIIDYEEFASSHEGANIVDDYLKNINILKIITDKGIINQITYTYTFLNKYNKSTTIFNMDELASIFF